MKTFERLLPAARNALGLRTRLTVSYVLLFALVMVSTGLTFRQALVVIFNQQNERLLDGDWNALKGFLRARQGNLVWAYDPESPEESYAVERLRRVFLLTTAGGEVVEISNGYSAIGMETAAQIRRVMDSREPVTVMRTDAQGAVYMVRMGQYGGVGRPYFAAIGLPVGETQRAPDRMLAVYLMATPVMLLAIGVLGWFAAGRALRPLMKVAAAAEMVSGGNLSLRIQPLETGGELDKLIATFNGMMERLEANFERMKRFSVDASHELRTPLTAIRGQLEVALLTAKSVDDYRRAIGTALEDVERLGRIVQSLLQMAQAETGQLILAKRPEMLAEIVAQHVAQYRLVAARKAIRLEMEAGDECTAEVDRTQIDRLVSNLLSNAVKYTQEGGAVSVRLWRNGGEAVMEVSDTGPGIAPHHLPHIFEKFYRIREGERSGDRGVGLGLAFVQWIVQAHGGKVEVRSGVGHGTTFEVRLPVGRTELEEPHEKPGDRWSGGTLKSW